MKSDELELVVRAMQPGDAEAIAALARQLGYDRSVEAVGRWIEELPGERERQAAFVACVGDEIVGWIEVSLQRHLQERPHGLIGGLVVKNGVRGRGIGRRLCEEAERWTWAQGLQLLRVTSRSTREAAHRFYLGDGYTEVKLSMVFEKTRPE